MGQFSLRPISLGDFGRHAMLVVTAAFVDGATSDTRQSAIKHLANLHGMNLANTKSMRYDQTLAKDGTNLDGDIRIGPGAFKQDYHWLAAVVFHETVHSEQFAFYAQNGVTFAAGQPPRSEPERIMIALDECEGFYWPWRNAKTLDLSQDQQNSLRREVQLWLIEIGDQTTADFVNKGQFDDARLALIKRMNSAVAGGKKP